MVAKEPTRNMQFTEQDETFIRQLSGDIGCFYRKGGERTYCLNKCNSDVPGQMGVFAWVHKEADDYFWITTRRDWAEQARASAIAGGQVSAAACFPRNSRAGDSVLLDVKEGYQKTVQALKLINSVRL